MNESAPETGAGLNQSASDGDEPTLEPPVEPSRPTAAPLLAYLESLHELQTALSQEERDDEILRVGTTTAVEVLGVDCGLSLVAADGDAPPLRFGWREGCQLAQHEIEIITRNLDESLEQVRRSCSTRIILASEPGDGAYEVAGEPPGALRSRGLGSFLILGLGKGAGRIGELILGRREATPFSTEQILLAEILALLFAVQIERVRRTSEARNASVRAQQEIESATRPLKERNQELESLNAVTAAVSPSFELHRQLDLVLRRAAEVTGHTSGAIYLVETEPDGEELLKLAHCLDIRERATQAGIGGVRKGEGLAGRVWAGKSLLSLADLRTDPDAASREDLVRAGCHGLLMAPLRARGRTIGVLELTSKEEHFYLDDERKLAQAIADQVTLMIQTSRLLSDLMRHSLELEGRAEVNAREIDRQSLHAGALHGVIKDVMPPGGLDEGLASALDRILDLVGAETGAIHMIDPGSGSRVRRAGCGTPEDLEAMEAFLRQDPSVDRAIASGEDQLADTQNGFLAVVPLRSLERVVGTLSVTSGSGLDFEEEIKICLSSLGAILGLVVEMRTGAPRPLSGQAQLDTGGISPLPPGLVQAQKLASIGTLAGGIAHDFNNIVGAVLGYATHIKALVTKDNPIFRHASIIEEQSLRACELTQQLLAFARGGESRRVPIDMNLVIEETVALLSRSVGATIELEVQTDPDLPAVEADPVQMKQVLLNLAVNARDAMQDGGRITFETRMAHLDQQFVDAVPHLRPGDYVGIVVGDTGPGMRPETVEHLFEPFFTTKPVGCGSGLGLSVVYGVVKSHGGHATISSTPGVGTTVRLYLPPAGRPISDPDARRDGPDPEAPASKRPPQIIPLRPYTRRPAAATGRAAELVAGSDPDKEPVAPAADDRDADEDSSEAETSADESVPVSDSPDRSDTPGRILVVDDEEALRELAHDILKSRGLDVILAKDGVEALDAYRREWGQISLVLLDMVMPRLGGLETFRRLRGMDRGTRVLLCSGYSQNEQAQTAIKEGAVGLLPKPYTMTELLAWVDKIDRRGTKPRTRRKKSKRD
jgi:signal transduction histidine kinase/CheY-like chemotaxis protein/transcriptional regulator with GAF, ATPase, and Fis domain